VVSFTLRRLYPRWFCGSQNGCGFDDKWRKLLKVPGITLPSTSLAFNDLREGNHLKELGIEKRIILKWVFKK
jgi:hypothetical protein